MADKTETPAPAKVGIVQALILTAIVMLALIGFLALGHALRMAPVYAGLLFFWYWISVDKGDFPPMPAAILGALGGTAHAWLLQWSAQHHSGVGLSIFLALLVIAVFVQIAELLPIVINACYMLFLTVTAAPLLQGAEDFRTVIFSILLGAVYFGLFVFAAKKALALSQPKDVP